MEKLKTTCIMRPIAAYLLQDQADIEQYYLEQGNGEPFIFLHGNGENSSYFEKQIDYFGSRYHVFALDTRGHGRSPRGNAPFTIEQFSTDLHFFMETQGIQKAIILGFSDGANIAMRFAIKHPDMVGALILNGGNLSPKGVKRATQLPIEIGYKIATCFAKKSPKAKKNAEMLGLMVNDPNIDPGELSVITAPTLVICGSRDMIKETHTREIASGIPKSKLVIIEGDHFIANKNPDEFNKAVEEFLDNVSQ